MFVAKHAGESTDGLSPRRVENEDPVIHCISGNWRGVERDERVSEWVSEASEGMSGHNSIS